MLPFSQEGQILPANGEQYPFRGVLERREDRTSRSTSCMSPNASRRAARASTGFSRAASSIPRAIERTWARMAEGSVATDARAVERFIASSLVSAVRSRSVSAGDVPIAAIASTRRPTSASTSRTCRRDSPAPCTPDRQALNRIASRSILVIVAGARISSRR